MGEPKKISFGFSKIAKKEPLILAKKEPQPPSVQFIDCLEGNSIKFAVGSEDPEKKELIIPMKTASSIRDRIKEAIEAREEMKKKKERSANGQSEEPQEKEPVKPLTLDEMAAKEILEDLQKAKEEETESQIREVPIVEDQSLKGEKESTLDDYDNMPIKDFGLAMLRGMGWDPKKGIGLNEKVVEPTAPSVRPKGMGLGADKAFQNKAPLTVDREELFMKKGAPVKAIAGPHSGLYGKVEGFDELPGRIIVRFALSDNLVSLSEFMVELVTNSEFSKNSKVMNIKKYDTVSTEMKDVKVKLEKDSKPIKKERSRSPVKHRSPERRKNHRRDSSSSPERHKSYHHRSKHESRKKRTPSPYSRRRSPSNSSSDRESRKPRKKKSHKGSRKRSHR